MRVLKTIRKQLEKTPARRHYDLLLQQTEEGIRATHFLPDAFPTEERRQLNLFIGQVRDKAQFVRGKHPATKTNGFIFEHLLPGAMLSGHEERILSQRQQFNGYSRLFNLIKYLERRQRRGK